MVRRLAFAYVTTPDDAFHRERIGRLMDLLVEYKPLTEAQWAKQTPEDAAKWKAAEALRQRYDALLEQGEAARFSPEWIRLALEAGPEIDVRPQKNEPVAPYIPPATPETRDRSPEEAHRILEQDWRHQANGDFSPDAIRNEIRWVRVLATRLMRSWPERVDLSEPIARLDELGRQAGRSRTRRKDLFPSAAG